MRRLILKLLENGKTLRIKSPRQEKNLVSSGTIATAPVPIISSNATAYIRVAMKIIMTRIKVARISQIGAE